MHGQQNFKFGYKFLNKFWLKPNKNNKYCIKDPPPLPLVTLECGPTLLNIYQSEKCFQQNMWTDIKPNFYIQ
jgi:hypothetical protein